VNFGRTLFSQVMDFVPWTSFDRIVTRHSGDVRTRFYRFCPCTLLRKSRFSKPFRI